MCLAVPGKVIRKTGDGAEIDMQGNRMEISVALVPEVKVNEYVLVHAGFAIQTLSEEEARETFELLQQLADASEPGVEPK